MFVFLIALKHPDSSKDWNAVCRIFCETIRTMSAQSGEFRAVVVCNRTPKGNFPDWVIFHEVDFPPVPLSDEGKLTLSGRLRD